MALARARLSPSTVISTVVPRATPSGCTVSRVGGVVRLPLGWIVLSAASTAPAKSAAWAALTRTLFRSHRFLMIHLVNLQKPIEQPGREPLTIGGELQTERPIHLLRHGANL